MPMQENSPETKLLIFTPRITARIQYTFTLFFKHLGKLPYGVTSNQKMAEAYNGPVLNYSGIPISNALHFYPNNLLFERELKDLELEAIQDQGLVGMFKPAGKSPLRFDPFASAFFLVSRYEEYLPFLGDLYNRFDAHQSFAHKNGFMEKAMVNRYALFLFDLLEKYFENITVQRTQYRFLNTIDVDNAWAYKEKGMVRTIGGIGKDVLTGNWKNLNRRLTTLAGKRKDPYDNYSYLLELQEHYGFKSLYFFLLADYGLNDKNVPFWNPKFRSLIQSISDHAEIGIHPGFGSNHDFSRLEKEIKRLHAITKFDITKSRQHFLILNLPETYRRLIAEEISDDFSMGFATAAGFRASICTPFPFFDLDREEETTLMVHPFTVMDATLKYYMKLEPDDACKVMVRLAKEVREVGGTFIGLWHNETVSDEGIWKGWRNVYETMIKEAIST
jgi:hypothetical protein